MFSIAADNELQIGVDGVKMFGYLQRKPTKEAANKKAHSRVWKKFFVVLKEKDLMFYHDDKEAKIVSCFLKIVQNSLSEQQRRSGFLF